MNGVFSLWKGSRRGTRAAGLLQWYAAADDLDDIGPREQFIDEVLGDGAGHAD